MASKGGIAVLVLFGLAALASADSSCQNNGDNDFDFDGQNASTCDGVVVIQSASASASVPGNTSLISSDSSVSCVMHEGSGNDEAVTALQTALVQCNGQSVTIDGNFGAATTQAVANVQRQHGLPADGAYGPATLEVMSWPTGSGGCVSSVSVSSVVVDEAS
ncbi:MAG TPA: peptidoglycan-binding domain-containing protein [Acidimicrobiales bacterium]|nr:peptidoglycan-binding domain-containing protein [Acidimicrobiales bacterium]